MTMTANAPTRPVSLPQNIVTLVMTVLIAGAFSTVAFDFFGKSLSPMLGFGGLAPVPLANGVIKTIFGAGYTPGAHALHYFAGMIAYPAGWVLFAEPLRRRFAPQVHWLIAATVYGVALWVWALYFMAHLVAGNPPFLGWATITWVALVGHVLFALVTATVTHLRRDV